jgi:hypothetical protein
LRTVPRDFRAAIELQEAPFVDGVLDRCGGIDGVRRGFTSARPHSAQLSARRSAYVSQAHRFPKAAGKHRQARAGKASGCRARSDRSELCRNGSLAAGLRRQGRDGADYQSGDRRETLGASAGIGGVESSRPARLSGFRRRTGFHQQPAAIGTLRGDNQQRRACLRGRLYQREPRLARGADNAARFAPLPRLRGLCRLGTGPTREGGRDRELAHSARQRGRRVPLLAGGGLAAADPAGGGAVREGWPARWLALRRWPDSLRQAVSCRS